MLLSILPALFTLVCPSLHAQSADRAREQSLFILPANVVADTISECDTRDLFLRLVNRGDKDIPLTRSAFTGVSAAEFSLRFPAQFPIIARMRDTLILVLRLTPQTSGHKTAFFQLLNDSLLVETNIVSLDAEVTKAALAISPVGLGFGPVNVGQARDLRLTLVNTGSREIVVQRIGIVYSDSAFRVMNNNAPFILKPGETFELIIRFAPYEAGNNRNFLQINSSDCSGRVSVVSLDGIGVIGTIARVSLPPLVRGKPGSTVLIPIRLMNRIADRPASAFQFRFHFNPTTIQPVEVHFQNCAGIGYSADWSIAGAGVMQVKARGMSPIVDSGLIINIVARVFLGDAESFPLRLEPFEFADNSPYATAIEGLFMLDSLCSIQNQLIKRKDAPRFISVAPNPFHESATVEYFLPVEMNVSILLLGSSSAGSRVILEAAQTRGNHRLHLPRGEIRSGSYQLIIRSSTGDDIRRIVLLR